MLYHILQIPGMVCFQYSLFIVETFHLQFLWKKEIIAQYESYAAQ